MDDIFIRASRLKLRFEGPGGYYTVEDLWDLHLTSATGKANLNSIAVDLHSQLAPATISFVDQAAATKAGERLQLMFDVVKAVIDIRLAEAATKREDDARAARKQRIREILADKRDEGDKAKSIEELEAELAGL